MNGETTGMVPVKTAENNKWVGVGINSLIAFGSILVWEAGKWVVRKIRNREQEVVTPPKTRGRTTQKKKEEVNEE